MAMLEPARIEPLGPRLVLGFGNEFGGQLSAGRPENDDRWGATAHEVQIRGSFGVFLQMGALGSELDQRARLCEEQVLRVPGQSRRQAAQALFSQASPAPPLTPKISEPGAHTPKRNCKGLSMRAASGRTRDGPLRELLP